MTTSASASPRGGRGHNVEMVLIRGNHDRHLKALPPEWRLDVHEEHLDEGPFRFAHHPEPSTGRYLWAGHLHPVVRLSSGPDRLRLPCFRVGPTLVGVLPAFSAFTGGLDMKRKQGERLFVIADGTVVELYITGSSQDATLEPAVRSYWRNIVTCRAPPGPGKHWACTWMGAMFGLERYSTLVLVLAYRDSLYVPGLR